MDDIVEQNSLDDDADGFSGGMIPTGKHGGRVGHGIQTVTATTKFGSKEMFARVGADPGLFLEAR